MKNSITKPVPAATAPATRSPQPPSWPQSLAKWTDDNCRVKTWSTALGEAVLDFRPPVTVPAEIRELAESHLATLAVASAPAPRREILGALARLAVHFPDSRTREEWRVLHADYADALAGTPPDILAAAAAAYLRRGRFYPKLAELIEIVDALQAKRADEIWELRTIAESETPEERTDRLERERRRAEAEKADALEAECRRRPFLRVFFAWADVIRWTSDPLIDWHEFVEEQVARHGVDTVQLWHADAALALCDNNRRMMPFLEAKAKAAAEAAGKAPKP